MKGLLLALEDCALETVLAAERHAHDAKKRSMQLRLRRRRAIPRVSAFAGAEGASGAGVLDGRGGVPDAVDTNQHPDNYDSHRMPIPIPLRFLRAEREAEREVRAQALHPRQLPPAEQAHREHGKKIIHLVKPLNDHELLVLQLLSLGYTTEQTGHLTSLRSEEVCQLVRQACERLGSVDLADAVTIARAQGLIR
jgi:hypothetical protein